MNDFSAGLTDLTGLQRNALIAGVIALALCAAGAFLDPAQFFHSYLMAFIFWLGVPLGCFAVLMIHHLVGGTWGFVMQRPLESAIRTFPVMALLFLPLLVGLSDLYPWARPDAVAQDPALRSKVLYLNTPFFIARSGVYFTIWISVGYFLSKWSREQDRTGDDSLVERLQTLSGPGLVLYGLTVTFSSIDWVMSLEPRWYSTIYGMIFMVSHGVVALAFMIGAVFFLSRRKPLAEMIAPWIFQDLGNLMLAFIMLWAYTSFSQFLLIWAENLVHEIPWYLNRLAGGWAAVGSAVAMLQFALPFLLLLSRAVKRKAEALCAVATMIAFMHLVEMFWFVEPVLHSTGFHLSWMDVLAPVGIGGVWFAAFLWQLGGQALLPFRDPRLTAIIKEHELVKNG
jgi:hypothetical protein